MKSEKNYGIEALRTISMVMICILHTLTLGGVLSSLPDSGVRYEACKAVEAACYVAINCYALLSGYVGISSRFRWEKVLKLWVRVVFYCGVITLICMLANPGTMGREQIIIVLTPIMHNRYWYVTAYMGLLFLSPILNTGLISLRNSQCFTLLAMVMFISATGSMACRDVFNLGAGYSLIWLILLYSVGGCLTRVRLNQQQKWAGLVLYVIGVTITWLGNESAYQYTAPGVVVGSVGLFLFFAHTKFGQLGNRCMKQIGPLVFSVYLIHTHPFTVQYILAERYGWIATVPGPVIKMIVCVVGQGVLIFVACLFIDFLREKVFALFKVDKICTWVAGILEKVCHAVGEQLFGGIRE